MEEFITSRKIPVGQWLEAFVEGIIENFSWFFDGLASFFSTLILSLVWILQTPPPSVVVAFVALGGWFLHRSWKLVLLIFAGLFFIINQGYWIETTETLGLVLSSAFICMIIGVPLGIWAAQKPVIYLFMRPVLDLMQTIPTFVYLIPALILFGLGEVPGLFATIIFALPAPIRLTYLGITSTPVYLVEVGKAFGGNRFQVLYKIQIPYAMPQIMAGLTQAIMLSLSMVVIAALVGANGLGVPTLRALNQVNIAKGFEAGLAIVIIAIILDRLLNKTGGIARKKSRSKKPSDAKTLKDKTA